MLKLPTVLFFAALTFLCWGSYGPVLHHGVVKLEDNAMLAFFYVGIAYFAIAVITPIVVLRDRCQGRHRSDEKSPHQQCHVFVEHKGGNTPTAKSGRSQQGQLTPPRSVSDRSVDYITTQLQKIIRFAMTRAGPCAEQRLLRSVRRPNRLPE